MVTGPHDERRPGRLNDSGVVGVEECSDHFELGRRTIGDVVLLGGIILLSLGRCSAPRSLDRRRYNRQDRTSATDQRSHPSVGTPRGPRRGAASTAFHRRRAQNRRGLEKRTKELQL